MPRKPRSGPVTAIDYLQRAREVRNNACLLECAARMHDKCPDCGGGGGAATYPEQPCPGCGLTVADSTGLEGVARGPAPAVGRWSSTELVAQGVTGPHPRRAGELVVDLVDAYCTGWSAPIVAERLREMALALSRGAPQTFVGDITMLRGLAALIEEALR